MKYKLDYREMYKIRHKEKRTAIEQRLIEYRTALCLISEALVDCDKGYDSKEDTLRDIRKYLEGVELWK